MRRFFGSQISLRPANDAHLEPIHLTITYPWNHSRSLPRWTRSSPTFNVTRAITSDRGISNLVLYRWETHAQLADRQQGCCSLTPSLAAAPRMPGCAAAALARRLFRWFGSGTVPECRPAREGGVCILVDCGIALCKDILSGGWPSPSDNVPQQGPTRNA